MVVLTFPSVTAIQEHRTQLRIGTTTFSVEMSSLPDDAGGTPPRVVVSLAAAGPEGEVIADGQLEVDLEIAATLGTVVQQTLHAVAGMDPRSARGPGVRRANQGVPWTPDMDAELERRWIEGEDVETIAEAFARSPGSIRARLPRVGCDPVRPGAYLPEPPSRRAS